MAADALSEEDIRSIKRLVFAMGEFEPFAREVITDATLDRLIEAGLAEQGRSCRPAVGSLGYRLTDDGWRIARERWNREQARVDA